MGRAGAYAWLLTLALLVACGSASDEAAPDPGTAGISGQIWLDVCEPTADDPLPAGCILGPQGTAVGNGIADPLDPVLWSAWLVLWRGACPGEIAFLARASEQDGEYEFTGLPGGVYCLFIDQTVGDNVRVLGPGTWTLPAGYGTGPVMLQIELEPGEVLRGLNFAYDPSEAAAP